MKTFNFKAVYSQLLTPEIVFRLTQLHEYKGRLNRLLETDAAALSEIKETAALQTVAASNRMEGITVAEDRLKKLILNKTNPQTDDEKKVAGYRDVLTSISANYDFLPPAPPTILQLHRDLYKFSGKAVGGNYKDTNGEPCAESLASLCNAFEQALQDPILDPLLLIPMFMVDFLNIAPFDNGTERMSRLLLALLLYRSGYHVEQYSSVDAILLNTKGSYDTSLQRSSHNWAAGTNDYAPFTAYLLNALVTAYKNFDEIATQLTAKGLSKPDRVREIIKSHQGEITKSEILKQCPDISQITVQRALADLLNNEQIIKIGGGRYTSYLEWRELTMITGELKNKIDSLWDIFAAGGLVNPLDVIEQITYLMFIHDLDDSDNLRAKEAAMLGLPYQSIFADEVQLGERTIDGQQLKWSVFHDFPAQKMYATVQEWVFPFIKNLHGDKNSAYSKYMDDAIFKLPTPLLLSKVVDALDEIYRLMNESQAVDVRGDTYEYLLSKIAQSGLNGQFRTPRHIIKMMVELMNPKADEVICDPACGTSGFLVAAGEYLKENRKEEIFFDRQKKDHYMNHMFFGYDMDRTMLRIGAMNMMTHGIDNPYIEYRDSLSDQNPDKEKYSLILANPPFKGSLDADTVSGDLLKVCKTKKTELLFLALFLRMLKIGGRCACIVPDGVLFGSSTAHKAIRKELVDGNRLEAVISMPSGVFKPYAGVSTAILIFTKTGHGGTDNVWFYDMQADGLSLDDKRSPVQENDIPDIVARFKNLDAEKDRARTEKSFFVPKQEIVDNGYDLSINKYKKTEYKPVEYPPTSEIMAELRRLEKEVNTAMDELEVMLNG